MIELAWIKNNEVGHVALELKTELMFGENEDESREQERKQEEEERSKARCNNRITVISTASVAAIGAAGYGFLRYTYNVLSKL